LVIRGAMATDSVRSSEADVGIVDGRIAAIGSLGSEHAATVVEARGLTLIPGLIDTQVHFREPGLEHKEDLESGTRAALMGGVTSVLEMPNTQPSTTSAEALADKVRRASGRAWCHFGFFVGASTDNIAELGALEELPGTPGIKIFMGSSTGSLLVADDEHLRAVLSACKRRCPIHAEDEPRNRDRKSLISANPHPREHPFLRDAESARLATERILRLSGETRHPVHILHVSTADEPPMIAEAKRRGLGTTAEVTPQHLYFFGPDCYERLGTLVQMNPPIRSKEHQEGLWRALGEGVFDVFGSDHAPHTLAEKSQPYPASPSGMPGVQTMLPVLLTFAAQGRLDIQTIVRMACENPAKLYGIRGKGRLEVGFDADLVLIDPSRRYVFERSMVESKCGWSPYEGETLTGSVEHVFVNGRHAVRDGERIAPPAGRMLEFGDSEHLGAAVNTVHLAG
jgi:dihydroorotase